MVIKSVRTCPECTAQLTPLEQWCFWHGKKLCKKCWRELKLASKLRGRPHRSSFMDKYLEAKYGTHKS